MASLDHNELIRLVLPVNKQYFSKPGDTFLVFLCRLYATPCLVSSCFIFSGLNIPPLCIIMTASGAVFNWFAQCLWWILHMRKVWNGSSYLLKGYAILNISKNPDNARRGQARQDKTWRGSTQKRRCLLVLKTLHITETSSHFSLRQLGRELKGVMMHPYYPPQPPTLYKAIFSWKPRAHGIGICKFNSKIMRFTTLSGPLPKWPP